MVETLCSLSLHSQEKQCSSFYGKAIRINRTPFGFLRGIFGNKESPVSLNLISFDGRMAVNKINCSFGLRGEASRVEEMYFNTITWTHDQLLIVALFRHSIIKVVSSKRERN
jgi:hypothetical protein